MYVLLRVSPAQRTKVGSRNRYLFRPVGEEAEVSAVFPKFSICFVDSFVVDPMLISLILKFLFIVFRMYLLKIRAYMKSDRKHRQAISAGRK